MKKWVIMPLALVIGFSLPVTKAYAILDNLFNKKQAAAPAALYPIHDDATFATLTQPFRQTPFNNFKLEFEITLPKEWTAQTLGIDSAPKLSQKILSPIARFDAPITASGQPFVTIQSQ